MYTLVHATASDAGQRAAAPLSRAVTAAPELWLAGIAFAVYPAVRPFSDEVSHAGVLAFASTRWVVAHAVGIVAFTLLGLGLARLAESVGRRRGLARAGLAAAWIGIGLTLPYYGAEVFGLHAAGQQGRATGDVARFDALVHDIRLGPGIWFILLGLVALAVGLVLLVTAAWSEATSPRTTLPPLAVGVALYLPQFAAPQQVRVAHGLLMTAGCLLLARGIARWRG